MVVDDEEDILELLKFNLEKEGYEVKTTTDGKYALDIIRKFEPNLVVLDVMMAELDGIVTCMEIRNIVGINQPMIVFLSARSEDYTQIAAFEAGGDDYIVKPIKPRVFLTRIKALLKRKISKTISTKFQSGDFSVNFEKREVKIADDKFHLPKKQFELLKLLIEEPGKVFDRATIMHRVWGNEVIVSDGNIDVLVRKLREKIGNKRIQTLKGVGYKFLEAQ